MSDPAKHPASFRDPSGFLFRVDGSLFRQVNQHYQAEFESLIETGLYSELVDQGLLLPHTEVDIPALVPGIAYKVIKPEEIPFISYPYEWCFSELKQAALATLKIQKIAFKHGMSLKDATAYNIQFRDGKPVLIDTLSFETYQEGKPWVPYRQYCQHFLAPLALMSYVDIRLEQLLRVYIDGIPLDLASGLLPFKSRLNFGLASHLHLHAASQKRYADKEIDKETISRSMSRNAFQGLIDSLESATRKLEWNPAGTEWGDYYEASLNYSDEAFQNKKELVEAYLERIAPETVWDLGSNTGVFSRLASQRGIPTLSFDIDPVAVEVNYRTLQASKDKNLLPLLLDLTNPSASIGWHNRERMSLLERGPAHAVLALALIHHLAISNNVPLGELADFFASLSKWLIIEFVPKGDSQVRRLLATREDIFPEYTPEGFEAAFSSSFRIADKQPVEGSSRILYLMENRSSG
jgi:hypothetical protein